MQYENQYKEAMRYLDNAREALVKAGNEGKFYNDEKYVKTACGVAYSGMLKALDFIFEYKGVTKRKGRKSIEYYKNELSKFDKKLLKHLNNGYEVLHLYGYYDGGLRIDVIAAGFDDARTIIDFLKTFSSERLN